MLGQFSHGFVMSQLIPKVNAKTKQINKTKTNQIAQSQIAKLFKKQKQGTSSDNTVLLKTLQTTDEVHLGANKLVNGTAEQQNDVSG